MAKTSSYLFITSARHAFLVIAALAISLTACKKTEETTHEKAAAPVAAAPASPMGVGPIKSLELGPLDEAMAAKGEKFFSGTCAACHKLEKRYVGPALAGVTKRRHPVWIMNMIMNPVEMTQKDDTAKALMAEYMTQMSVSASEEDARAVLEFFRKQDGT